MIIRNFNEHSFNSNNNNKTTSEKYLPIGQLRPTVCKQSTLLSSAMLLLLLSNIWMGQMDLEDTNEADLCLCLGLKTQL